MSSSLIDLLTQQIQSGGLSQIAGQLGTDESTAGKAVPAALGTLIGALAKNASSGRGAEDLFGALSRDHDGSILNDIGGAISNSGNLAGSGILKHVLGGNRQSIEKGLGQATGLDAGAIGKLLPMLAPILMGALGKARNEGNLDVGGLAGMLGQQRQHVQKQVPRGFGLGSLIDRDGDGQIADDLAGMVGKGLLKNLFGGGR
ncbi:MAG: DUF937 domain-containing protein [Acidobacteriota bacterium]|nr:DUF937 domain-containing protein [Acidobacteriota bacterium]